MARTCVALGEQTARNIQASPYSWEDLHDRLRARQAPDALVVDAALLADNACRDALATVTDEVPTVVWHHTGLGVEGLDPLPGAVAMDTEEDPQPQTLWDHIGQAVGAVALHQVGEPLARLVRDNPHLCALVDATGRLLYVNTQACLVLDHCHWWGTRIHDWIDPRQVDELDKHLLHTRQDRHWVTRTMLKRADGSFVPTELTLIHVGEPERTRAFVVARDLTVQQAAERDLQESAERFQRLVELSPDAMFVESQGTVCYVNRAGLELVGAGSENAVVGQPAAKFVHADSYQRALERSRRVARGETVPMSRETIRRLDGDCVDVEITSSPIVWQGRTAIQGLVRDVSEREQAARALAYAEQRLTDILGSIDNVIWSASIKQGRLLYLSPAAEALYGRPVHELLEDQSLWRNAIHPEDRPFVLGSLRRLLREGSTVREFRIVRADGSIRWVEDRLRVAYDKAGNATRIDGVSNDITQRKEHEEYITYLANYDELTGLPNRNLFSDRLSQLLPQARRSNQPIAVIFVGIDRLKHINDSFGHAVGDRLLCSVAQRLREQVSEGESLARFAGDEFILLLPQLSGPDAAASVAQRILATMATPFELDELDELELHIGVSLGISLFPTDGHDTDSLIHHADTAMFRAKSNGGDSFQFYTDEMGEQALERAELESALRRAQQREELELHYQPQVELGTGRVVGFEALLRWRHATQGLISPARFIPLAEETGLILPIGAEVLTRACQQMRDWQRLHGLDGCRVSVNLSARQFLDEQLVPRIEAALRESGLESKYLDVELTETAVMQNEAAVAETLVAIKALGVNISMDDFGTGYSSLSYLKRFPIDRVKIDKSFIQEMMDSTDDAVIADAIISLGHSLGLTVVAEGVETAEQRDRLLSRGCDEVQGFYFSKPMPPEDCAKRLHTPLPWRS